MRRRALFAILILSVFAVTWVAGLGSFPLGVPDEWEWNRVPPSEPLALALAPALMAGALYVGFVWLGSQSIARCRGAASAAWLFGLAAAGFLWLWVAQESAPQNYQLSKAAWVLYYRGSSGYFSEARDRAADLRDYLANYERQMEQGDVLHIGTHPPGLVVGMRGLLGLCRQSPRLASLLALSEPASVRAAFDELGKREALTSADRATLWLAALVVQACAALTVIPLFCLLAGTCQRKASWQAVAFWPTVPALALFLPKSDCLFPFLAVLFLWFWLEGLARRSIWHCVMAGLVIWFGLTLSLAFLPVGFIGFLAGIWTRHNSPIPGREVLSSEKIPEANPASCASGASRTGILQRLMPAAACAATAMAVPTIAIRWTTGVNLLNVWRLNFQNHAGFYQQFPRTYWKWLLINPLEFAIAVGLPLVVISVWSLAGPALRKPGRFRGVLGAWLGTFALLWISGKNMGEAARLWIFLSPVAVWMVGPLFESPDPTTADSGALTDDGAGSVVFWLVALGAQLGATAALVTQVAGFHLP